MRTSSAPLSSGISQSRMTRSGATMRIASSPAMPSDASWTFLTPRLTRMLRTTFRMYWLSSMTSTASDCTSLSMRLLLTGFDLLCRAMRPSVRAE